MIEKKSYYAGPCICRHIEPEKTHHESIALCSIQEKADVNVCSQEIS